jgi:hypothetical protein
MIRTGRAGASALGQDRRGEHRRGEAKAKSEKDAAPPGGGTWRRDRLVCRVVGHVVPPVCT